MCLKYFRINKTLKPLKASFAFLKKFEILPN